MVDSRMAPSRNVEDRRSPLYSILETLISPRAPMMSNEGIGQPAVEPGNLPVVPRLSPGAAPMSPPAMAPGVMPDALVSEMQAAASSSPPMSAAPRLNGGSGGDIRGMAANDLLNATPAPRADAGGGVAPRTGPAPTGFTMADVDAARQFINSRTIAYRSGNTSPEAQAMALNLNPIAAVRTANMIAAGEAATGATAVITEGWRSDATQAVYYANQHGPTEHNGVTYRPDTYETVNKKGETVTVKRPGPGAVAPPGRSNHREGGGVDFSDYGDAGKVRSWMRSHAGEFGMRTLGGNFDLPHIEVNEAAPLNEEEANYVVRELGYADVKDFQAKNGLDDDGVVGPATSGAMLRAVAAPSVEAAKDPASKPFTVYSADINKAQREGRLNPAPPMTVADAFSYVPGEQPGAAQESLIAAADAAPVDYDSTVLPPDIPKITEVAFSDPGGAPAAPAAPVPRLRSDTLVGGPRRDALTPEQGTQTGDRSMSQRPRLNNQAGDRTMMQRPLDAQFSVVLDKIEAGQPLTDGDKAIVAAWQEQGGEPNEPIVQRARALLGPHPNEVAAGVLKPDGTPYDQPPGSVPAGDRPPPAPRLRPDPGELALNDAKEVGAARTMMESAIGDARPQAGNSRPKEEAAPERTPSATELAAADRTPKPPVPRLRSDAPAPTPNRRTIARGDKGDAVTELQKQIATAMPGLPTDFVDGEYGPYTEGVVMAMQERAARTDPTFKVDGIVGDQTWPLIDAAMSRIPTPTTRENAIGMESFDPLAGANPGLSVRGTDVFGGTSRTGVPSLSRAMADRRAADMAAMGSKFLADDLDMSRNWFESNTGQIDANGQPLAPFRPQASPPAIGGGTDVLSGFRGNSVVPRLTSGRSGPPIRIASSAPAVAALPRGMNEAAFPKSGFDTAHDYLFGGPTGLSDAAQWAGIADPPVTAARTPSNLSFDAMPGPGQRISDRFSDAFTPVAPASTTAPPPAPRLAPATTTAPTASGAPGAATPPAGGGVAGVYSGGGPTGGAPATYSSASSGSGPGASTGAPASTASTGSSGSGAPPSYYDSSRGGWQSWNSSTNSYQSSGVA